MSCSVGVSIQLKSGKRISHRFFKAEELQNFVMSCDITDVMKTELKSRQGTGTESWVLKNKEAIRPQMFATQRISPKGNKQTPRMMSFDKYYGDE